jgi:hypothetical protein
MSTDKKTTTETLKPTSLAHAHRAVIFAADHAEVMHRLTNNPATRRAADTMGQIVEMHRVHDHNPAREHQIAEDALFFLPMREIEILCAEYEATR